MGAVSAEYVLQEHGPEVNWMLTTENRGMFCDVLFEKDRG